MIRFRFELTPVDDVAPWSGELHWFGLTDGRYWIEAGGHEFLRRSRTGEAIDYYVARLWEDVNGITPDVLEPVPDDLAEFVATDSERWVCDPLEFIPTYQHDVPDHPAITASSWRSDRYLDFGYLLDAPKVRLWRTTRDEVVLDWRHRDDGFTAGAAARVSMPAAEYLEAVHTLDRDLMTAMRRRVEEVERRGGLPGIDIDVAGLRREHEDREKWLARRLEHRPRTDWDMVRVGARRLLGF